MQNHFADTASGRHLAGTDEDPTFTSPLQKTKIESEKKCRPCFLSHDSVSTPVTFKVVADLVASVNLARMLKRRIDARHASRRSDRVAAGSQYQSSPSKDPVRLVIVFRWMS